MSEYWCLHSRGLFRMFLVYWLLFINSHSAEHHESYGINEPRRKRSKSRNFRSMNYISILFGTPQRTQGAITTSLWRQNDVAMSSRRHNDAPCGRRDKSSWGFFGLAHWGRVTHICAGKLTIIGSDNGLSPGRRQAIILTNAGILSIGPLRTNFNEILIGNQTFSFKKMHLKMSSAK